MLLARGAASDGSSGGGRGWGGEDWRGVKTESYNTLPEQQDEYTQQQ